MSSHLKDQLPPARRHVENPGIPGAERPSAGPGRGARPVFLSTSVGGRLPPEHLAEAAVVLREPGGDYPPRNGRTTFHVLRRGTAACRRRTGCLFYHISANAGRIESARHFLLLPAYPWTEVMQFGTFTARAAQRPAGPCPFPWPDIGFHLFQGHGFGAFRGRAPGLLPVSCVPGKGGGQA